MGRAGANALRKHYTANLTQRGYAPATIDAELQGLKAVANLAKAASNAKGAAEKATITRNAAAKALKDWTAEFRKVAKHTLRGPPDLLSALGMYPRRGNRQIHANLPKFSS